MPLFETTIPIQANEIAEIIKKYWNLTLGKLIKASQNHTFEAFSADQKNKYAVRVTPDPENKKKQKIADELTFVDYLIKAQFKHLCAPIPPVEEPDKIYKIVGNLIIVVFQWARGVPLPYGEFRWMKDKSVVKAWGRAYAQIHKISHKFTVDHPEIVKRIQQWDEIHCGILKGSKLHPDDKAVINNPEHFGVIHGDLNTSNMYYNEEGDYMSVYDTDQVQQGFYLWDLAQAVFSIVFLDQGGLPISGQKVEGVNRKEFEDTIISGYQEEGLKIDRARLQRMVNLKKQLYMKFAKRAFQEGDIPKDMEPFLKWILECFGGKWIIEE